VKRRVWTRTLAPLLLAVACARSAPPPAPPPDPTAEQWDGPPADRGQLVVHDAFGGTQRLAVEIADTSPLRARGLMWRSALPDGTGMLFIFPTEAVQSFYMRNTLIPLDMLFLDRTGNVVGVVQWAEPQTLTSRRVGAPSLYVLEVPGGWTSRNGVTAGAKVELAGDLRRRQGQP
jgi:uncharacterized protein